MSQQLVSGIDDVILYAAFITLFPVALKLMKLADLET